MRLRQALRMSVWYIDSAELAESNFSRELEGDDYGGIAASVIFVDAEPGHGPRLHRHDYTELIFVLDGEATFTDGVEERVVRAGQAVIVSAGQPHAFVNSGTTALRQIDVHLNSRFVTEWLDPEA